MKKYSILFMLSVSACTYAATDTLDVTTKITDVTVFFNGAQVTRTVKMNFQKKKYFLRLEDLPADINPQSIQVKRIENCKILSVKHQLNYRNEKKDDKARSSFEATVKSEELKIKDIKNRLLVFDKEEKLLMDNSIISRKDDGSAVHVIREAADFYRGRLNEIFESKLRLSSQLDSANDHLEEMYRKYNEKNSKKKSSYSRVLIALECEREMSPELRLSYYISSAGWKPTYDFRVDDITKPLSIIYNANVYQSTGEDWNSVNFHLSTTNPKLSGDKPELGTFYLGRILTPMVSENLSGVGALKGSILESKTNEAIPFAFISVVKNGQVVTSGISDIDGQYSIKPIPTGNYEVKVAYVGYDATEAQNVIIEADKTTYLSPRLNRGIELAEVAVYSKPLIDAGNVETQKSMTMEEIQSVPQRTVSSLSARTAGVSINNFDSWNSDLNFRGSRNNSKSYFSDAPKGPIVETSSYIGHTLKETVANIEYAIEIPYTIPSDGEDYQIKIKESSVPVEYVYHAVPKLDRDVFLTAKIPDWTQLSLISGETSIYYQGTFVGQSAIDAQKSSDTLEISLGRDKGIIVTREGNKQLNDKKVSGNNFKETIGWDIAVKNNRNASIHIVVEDQYPLSERKSIEVELQNSSFAKVDEKTGKLEWSFVLEPNEKKMIGLQYTVKCPRYLNLALE